MRYYRRMRRYVYYSCFALLGFLAASLAHAGLELPLLRLIIANPDHYADSYWWQHWEVLHVGVGLILWVGGTVIGFHLGRHFWQILYVEERYGRPRF